MKYLLISLICISVWGLILSTGFTVYKHYQTEPVEEGAVLTIVEAIPYWTGESVIFQSGKYGDNIYVQDGFVVPTSTFYYLGVDADGNHFEIKINSRQE